VGSSGLGPIAADQRLHLLVNGNASPRHGLWRVFVKPSVGSCGDRGRDDHGHRGVEKSGRVRRDGRSTESKGAALQQNQDRRDPGSGLGGGAFWRKGFECRESAPRPRQCSALVTKIRSCLSTMTVGEGCGFLASGRPSGAVLIFPPHGLRHFGIATVPRIELGVSYCTVLLGTKNSAPPAPDRTKAGGLGR